MGEWVNLPRDLIERISNFCITPDHIRMQCVCKSWRLILKNTIPRELPWLMMLPNDKDEDPDSRTFFSLSKQKIHTIPLPEMRGNRCCGSFQNGWQMIEDDELDIFLFHPWSKRRINLPHHSTLTKQIYKDLSKEEIRDFNILKAAISDDGNVVVIVYGLGFLAFCRIGDDSYTHIRNEEPIQDVIYHKGKFYALSRSASVHLLHIDGSRPHIEKLTLNLVVNFKCPNGFFGYLGYLVPDILTDSMFMISRYVEYIQGAELLPHKTIHFDIFRVTLEESKTLKRFTQVKSLGQRVLFLGHNSPIVVIASEFPGFKGNRIYFANRCSDLGVFSVEDGAVEQIFDDRFHPSLSPSLWVATPPYSSQRDFGEKLWLEEQHDVPT